MAHSTRASAIAGFRTLILALMMGGMVILACAKALIRLSMCVDAASNPDLMADSNDRASVLLCIPFLSRTFAVAVVGLVLGPAVTSPLSVA